MEATTLLTWVISGIALVVSLIALRYTVKSYRRKSGLRVRGIYCKTSSIYCDDDYVGSIVLENMKDRSIVIFGIFLLAGKNYYIVLEDFEDNPLILKPFETYSKHYDPVDFYSVGMKRIKLDGMLSSKKAKPKLVLSTSEGRYAIKEYINRWNPIFDYFNNQLTAVIRPVRMKYKNKSYGSNVKYIVEIRMSGRSEEIIPIYPRDHEIKKFKKFNLTRESLASKKELEKFFKQKRDEGLLNCADIVVHNIEDWRNEAYRDYDREIIQAEYFNWFTYTVLGRIYTLISDIQLKLQNRKNRKKAAANKTKIKTMDPRSSQG